MQCGRFDVKGHHGSSDLTCHFRPVEHLAVNSMNEMEC
jgi:hypothetical protein